jgi:hypothetical protein
LEEASFADQIDSWKLPSPDEKGIVVLKSPRVTTHSPRLKSIDLDETISEAAQIFSPQIIPLNRCDCDSHNEDSIKDSQQIESLPGASGNQVPQLKGYRIADFMV